MRQLMYVAKGFTTLQHTINGRKAHQTSHDVRYKKKLHIMEQMNINFARFHMLYPW